jgi:hypothetical protein
MAEQWATCNEKANILSGSALAYSKAGQIYEQVLLHSCIDASMIESHYHLPLLLNEFSII